MARGKCMITPFMFSASTVVVVDINDIIVLTYFRKGLSTQNSKLSGIRVGYFSKVGKTFFKKSGGPAKFLFMGASLDVCGRFEERGAFDSAKNHKRQRRKRQSVTAKREKSQMPKFV